MVLVQVFVLALFILVVLSSLVSDIVTILIVLISIITVFVIRIILILCMSCYYDEVHACSDDGCCMPFSRQSSRPARTRARVLAEEVLL